IGQELLLTTRISSWEGWGRSAGQGARMIFGRGRNRLQASTVLSAAPQMANPVTQPELIARLIFNRSAGAAARAIPGGSGPLALKHSASGDRLPARWARRDKHGLRNMAGGCDMQ